MKPLVAVIAIILREALARRWLLALAVGISLLLLLLGLALRLDVVDGALAASSFFGERMGADIQAVDVALRPVFQATAYLVYYGSLLAAVLACADFAPSLLAPGRIEFMLAQPLRRWQLVWGIYLGVVLIMVVGVCYGVGGVSLILGIKTGYWTAAPLVAALLAAVAFSALYAAMLVGVVLVRSAALSVVTGVVVFVAGIVASHRHELAAMFEAGPGRAAFSLATLPLPRIASLADAGARIAGSEAVPLAMVFRLATAHLVIATALVVTASWLFERKDW